MRVSTRSLSSLILAFALLGVLYPSPVTADLVLNEKIMKISKIAAELSVLTYAEYPPSKAYDTFGFFDDEPDQALVAKKLGYCFAAFRGTTLTAEDWRQNFKLGNEEVCTGPKGDEQCCSTRTGYFQAYNTAYKDDMEAAIRACAKECLNPDECVVLTGHSQGGAVAAVAALYLSDLNPYVITFGQPSTVDQPCPLITSERYYRYVNSKDSLAGRVHGVSYDPVPFTPGLGTDSFGHMILLSSDTTGVAYIGLDAQDFFGPLDLKAEAHSMGGDGADAPPGYLDRIKTIMHTYSKNQTYPIRTSGYVAGTLWRRIPPLRTAVVSEWNARKTRIAVLDVVTLACVSPSSDRAWHATKTLIALESIVCNSVVRARMVSWMTIATVIWIRIAIRGVARVCRHLFVNLSWESDPSATKTRIVSQNTARGASVATTS
jgi:pimeloyl-ACP methyl ester carboxylesterase